MISVSIRQFRREIWRIRAAGRVICLLVLVCGLSSFATTSASAGTAQVSKAANKSLSPVEVGFSNTDAGTEVQFPAITQGAESAVGYINAELGGIHGHPLKLVDCPVVETPQSNQACGEQFANNSSVHLVVTGISLAGGSLYTALNAVSKPVIESIPVDPGDYTAPPNTWAYMGGGAATYVGMADYARTLKNLKTIAYLYADNAGGESGESSFVSILNKPSVKVTAVPIPVGSSDILPQVTAADVANADLVVVAPSDCGPAQSALHTLNPKGTVLGITTCLSNGPFSSIAPLMQNWVVTPSNLLALSGKGVSPALNTFLANYTKYGHKVAPGVFSENGWGIMITVANLLNSLSSKTISDNSALLAAVKGFKGPVVLGQSKISCPGVAPYPSVCTLGTEPFQIRGTKLLPVKD